VLHQETAGNYATLKWIVAKHAQFGHGEGMKICVNDGKPTLLAPGSVSLGKTYF